MKMSDFVKNHTCTSQEGTVCIFRKVNVSIFVVRLLINFTSKYASNFLIIIKTKGELNQNG